MAETHETRTPLLLTGLLVLCAVLAPVTIYQIFFVAPVEEQMGIVYKIFFIHVPVANAMYVCFITCGVCSAVYLAKRDVRWDAVAVAAGEVGLLFCLAVLASGPLWGRKAWGVYWTWDPRLTSTLLAGMVFAAYIMLRSFGSIGEVEKRFGAGLAIFGLLDLWLIKKSVEMWRGTHPTVISGKGGGIHDDMKPAFALAMFTFILFSIALIWVRARTERARQRVLALELEAAEAGLLEEA